MSTKDTKDMTTEIALQDTILDFEHLSPIICMELACGLSDVESVREKYDISEAQWLRLRDNPTFKTMMKEAAATFSGDINAGKRITKKAEILLEESLPILHKIMARPDASTQAVLDTVKQLTTLAGRTQRLGEGAAGGGSGFNVQIHINTGDGEIRAEAVTSTPALEGEAVEVEDS
jgi:hypothetical protein